MHKKDDKYYLNEVLKGKSEAYRFIIDKYKSMAFTLALRLLKNREDAEETAHDAFIKCYYALPEFNFDSGFSTWLYRVVFNSSISRLREKRLITEHFDEIDNDSSDIAGFNFNSALNKLKHEEQSRYINLALNNLDSHESTILSLYYQMEKSIEEISIITGLSGSNIKIKLFRARKSLFNELQSLLKDEVYNLL